MIKETSIPSVKIIRQKYCDCCQSEIAIGLACSSAKCLICKKDLCQNCIGHEIETGGDYRDVYCKNCWDIGMPYMVETEKLHNEIEKLNNEWHSKCLSNGS